MSRTLLRDQYYRDSTIFICYDRCAALEFMLTSYVRSIGGSLGDLFD